MLLIRDALPGGRRERRSEGILCGILAASIVLIGPSRVALGDHWPTDVLGAYLLGGALLALLARWRLAPPRARPSEAPE
jgi:membrane-associated phospholipid phosphatase